MGSGVQARRQKQPPKTQGLQTQGCGERARALGARHAQARPQDAAEACPGASCADARAPAQAQDLRRVGVAQGVMREAMKMVRPRGKAGQRPRKLWRYGGPVAPSRYQGKIVWLSLTAVP